MRPCKLLALALSCLAFFTACGGGAGMHVQPSMPNFTSTPGTQATQDLAYSYQIAATDPAGGAVTFSLTTAPTGAALNGSTLSWTPLAAQSRVPNSFTVTATTSSGGAASQSWSVSPNGTVTVNDVITFWTSTGPLQLPVSTTASSIAAIVPQNGSLTVLPGAFTAPGVITIPGVPAGYYWLTFTSTLVSLPPLAYWTSASTVDLGRDIAGDPLPVVGGAGQTTFTLNLSGLDAAPVPTLVGFTPATGFLFPYLSDPASSTTLSQSVAVSSNIDWSKIKTAFLLQYEPATLGPLNNLVLGPSTTMTDLSLTNGTTNTITQALEPSPQASLMLDVPGSQWASLFTNASPSAPTQYSAGLSVVAEPYVSGINTHADFGGLTLASTELQISGFGFGFQPFGGCDGTGFARLGTNTQPAILTDQNLGTLQYGDPFPSSWARALTFCQEAVVPIPLPDGSSTLDFALVASQKIAPSNPSLAPLVRPVTAPTINGGSLFTSATLNTAAPTLAWSAPSGTAPYGYRVQGYVATTLSDDRVVYEPAGTLYTAKTSATLMPLAAGNTYVFAITALVDARANVESSPNRSNLPTGFASVVSAPMTVSSGAAAVSIHGDAKVVKRFSRAGAPAH